MTRPAPRLTLGLPVYNGERFLEEAAEAILGQTFGDFELLIADNGSTDRTEGICRGLAARDDRVRYVRHARNVGLVANHNFLVREGRGELFRWTSHDDLLAPTALEQSVGLLDAAGPAAVLTFPRTRMIDDHGNTLSEWAEQGSVDNGDPSARLRALLERPDGHLAVCSPIYGVIRAASLRRTRLLQPFFHSDLILIVELALLGQLLEVPEYLYMRRVHSDQSCAGPSDAPDAPFPDDDDGGRDGYVRRNLILNPDFTGYPMNQTWVMKGYFAAVLRTPLTSAERRRCLAALASALSRDRKARIILGEVRRAARARAAALVSQGLRRAATPGPMDR